MVSGHLGWYLGIWYLGYDVSRLRQVNVFFYQSWVYEAGLLPVPMLLSPTDTVRCQRQSRHPAVRHRAVRLTLGRPLDSVS